MLDPELLPELFVRMPEGDWVLVTADDAMPDDWADIIDWLKPTIATIDPRRLDEYDADEWGRDVVHRWAHIMQRQERHSVRRYALARHAPWKPIRRRKRPLTSKP
jgi:hypothetical protein